MVFSVVGTYTKHGMLRDTEQETGGYLLFGTRQEYKNLDKNEQSTDTET